MKLAFFMDIIMICLICFFLMKNKRNRLDNLFILMMVEFISICYYATVYINLDAWTIGKSTELFIIFRLYEIILNPLIVLFYFNLLPKVKGIWMEIGVSILFLGILFGVECWLVNWDVIRYIGWQSWMSLLAFALGLFILTMLFRGYQVLIK
ncbi:hypothetical protein [Bacillus sp. FJAT-49736]|uniref:hypothetical protein n=1 Tax=Bacillus sp. FJAT-49736 TaxID=2833582 RepID=UPI001BC9049B|nr:hypothetical protein [Bacillus sp. FJAT-49736]MBS4174371.1 hypothetical protein [Bacillus sp. FJAT-49736]